MPGPLPESGLEPLGTAAHWLQVVKTGKRYTAPGCRGGTVHSPHTLLLLQGPPSQRAGCFILRRCGVVPGLPAAWGRGAGRDFGKAGLDSAQMGSGRRAWQPLWLSPRRPVWWPGQPQALAQTSAHLLEFQRQMF